MRARRCSAVAACIAILCCCTSLASPSSAASLADDWTPQSAGLSRSYAAAAPDWADEFGEAITAGASLVTQPDSATWSKIIGPPRFNGEMQTYVDDSAHSAVSGGKLHLVASRNPDASAAAAFHSAKLSTAGKVSFKYGLFAARVRLPRGKGLWPSIWLFGDSTDKYEEISLVELGAAGSSDGRAASVAWFSKGVGQNAVRAGVPAELSVEPAAFADDFHVFWLEWTPHALTVGLDSVGQVLAGDLAETGGFQSSMHLILNVAVGGGWTGAQAASDITTELPQSMQVDWIRYWAAPELSAAGIVSAPTPAPAAIPAVAGIEIDRGAPTLTSTALPTSDPTNGGDESLLPANPNSAAEHSSSSRLMQLITLGLLVGAQAVLISLL